MKPKHLLLGSVAVGTGVALTRSLFTATGRPHRSPASPSFDAIDAFLERQLRRLRIPGAAFAIIEGDRVVHQRGFGHARPGGEVPSLRTPFALGSTTKSFTALAVMQLVEAGTIELEAPVRRYLPWFRVADPEASARMTVRHLLNQTSGLSMVAGTAVLGDIDGKPVSPERQARALSTLKLSRPVGTTFQYCNLNYNLLGLIVEAASGQSYAAYLREHIFKPLGMRHTFTTRAEARRHGLAQGHRYWFGFPIPAPEIPFPPGSLAAGGLVSTGEDLSRYLMALLNGGRLGEARILSRAGIAAMQHAAADQRILGKVVTSYGMGWFISPVDGTKLVSHGGNLPEFSSFLGLLPERKRAIVLLTNADHGLPFVLSEVGEGIGALLAGHQPPPIRFGFLPWMMRASLFIPFSQLAGLFATLRHLRRWSGRAASHPRREPPWRPVVVPLGADLMLLALLGYLRFSGLLRFMNLYFPDLAWIARISGGLAWIGSVVRSGWGVSILGGMRGRGPVQKGNR
ncbi:MAG TPA: serine hydrolase domain-containing protein [Anaerolineales bacterium]|nr:serine hydrolase domain-containing protein [Anaerolineales bacterium]